MKSDKQSERRLVIGFSLLLLSCVDDGQASEATATISDSDGSDTGGEANCIDQATQCPISPGTCVEPPAPSNGEPVPSYMMAEPLPSPDINTLTDCPIAVEIAQSDPVSGLEPTLGFRTYYPDDGMGGLPPRSDGYGLMIFSHGNSQSGAAYLPLMSTMAGRGVIAVSVIGDSNAGGPLRKHRLMCLAEALLDDHVDDWIAKGHLSGEYAFGGHSQGARGAFLATREVLTGDSGFLSESTLVGSLSIAPAGVGPGDETFIGGQGPFYFIIQGTGDGDTSGQGFSLYDQVRNIESGGHVLGAPRKAMIWAYGVEHTHWGGNQSQDGCIITEKAGQLIEGYVGRFIEAAFYDDPNALSVFFSATQVTPVLVDEVNDPALWTPEYGGQARVYGTSTQRVSPEDGFKSHTIDRFENGNLAESDSGLSVAVTSANFAEPSTGGGAIFDNHHQTGVGVLELSEDINNTFPDSIDWCLSCDARAALAESTSITFRIGFERDMNVRPCEGESYSLPDIRLTVETESTEASVDVMQYARIALPDTRFEIDQCSGTSDGCRTFNSLQATVRVPVEAFCQDGVTLDEATHVRLEFSSPNPVVDGFGTLLLLDDFELHRVPGEPAVSCRCGV